MKTNSRPSPFLALLLLSLLLNPTPARSAPNNDSPRQGAALLKTDLMAVLAHPDDETGIASTLARYALGENKVVVSIYATRGEGGGNMVGTHWGPSLGILRETELRHCLATLGLRSCYFLDRLDWAYTESASATMRKWNKEETLESLVRLVRALRPDVIVTMKPAPRPGRHGHHQAMGILATEAVSAAADPNRFPLQLTREGLTTWQTRRLYFSGGSDGTISTITVDQPLPGGSTPGQVAGNALSNHRSQAFGNFANSPFMQRPQKFTLVSSFIPLDGTETNLLAGLPAPDASLAPVPFPTPPPTALELAFIPRPAVDNYQRWIKQHQIEHVAETFPADLPLVAGEPNTIRIQLHNSSATPAEGELQLQAPPGWTIKPTRKPLRAAPHSTTSSDIQITPPAGERTDTDLTATFLTGTQSLQANAKLHPLPRTRVARLTTAPSLNGNDQGWTDVNTVAISPTHLAQGKVADEADSSARFRLAHDGKTLFVDVDVKDDSVVSNIAPNDIKGHWRSDSVEICIDPVVGVEHTLGSFKLGIFPFDSTGVVRAARDADANQGPVEETAPDTRIASRRTADGYRIQAAIPFKEIGLARNQKRLGFNIIIYDGDKPDAAPGENINKSRLAWAPRSGVQGRPEDWGRIDLE